MPVIVPEYFGKWHLGDNYPMRPSDKGFQETLIHKGGGIGQASDPPGNSYFNPILQNIIMSPEGF
jgi:arylsulfatase A